MKFLLSYWSQDVTASHYSLAVTILTTVIIGGCVILLVENQQTQGEILTRYYNVMRPFYHKFTLFAQFIQQCLFALRALDKEGIEYKGKIEKLCNGFKTIAFESTMTGKDASHLNAKYLDDVCTKANALWYMFDRNYEMYDHLEFNNAFLIEEVRSSLLEYDRSFVNNNIDIHVLPEVSGEFYVKVWKPIDNIPYRFEDFVIKSRDIGAWLYLCFAIEVTSLVIVYISESFDGVSLFSVDFLVLLSILIFVISLLKFLRIKSSILMLQF